MSVLPLLFLVLQSTTRVSVNTVGAQADFGNEHPVITRDGRYVVFTSAATNLGPLDTNGETDVYRKDLLTGAVELVSVDSNGNLGNGSSFAPSVSADGRYVAFTTAATNMWPLDLNGTLDVYVRDVATGTTILVSMAIAGGWTGTGDSLQASISADGSWIAYYSFAPDLVPGDLNGTGDAFVYDRLAAYSQLASRSSTGAQGNGASYELATFLGPAISDDGRYVAFVSEAGNLVAGDTNGFSDVFVRDMLLGTTVRASESATGAQANLGGRSATMSADGRWVAFGSDANSLVPNDTTAFDYFVKDLRTGAIDRVSVATGGAQGGGGGFGLFPTDFPSISAEGRFVTWGHKYANLVPGDTNQRSDVFLHDRWLGRTDCLSLDLSGIPGDNHSAYGGVSEDGRSAVFASTATDLVPADTNAASDVFLRSFTAPQTSFCLGDGSAGTAPCPCGNAGSHGHGCENSADTSGGFAFAEGTASVAADTVTLHAARLRGFSLAVFLQATDRAGGGLGVPWGDGLRCVGGSVVRLGYRSASRQGLVSFGAGVPGDPLVSVKGLVPPVGGSRHYQVLYRDGGSFCTGGTLNATNGMTIVWNP